jgi:hypothetical protein
MPPPPLLWSIPRTEIIARAVAGVNGPAAGVVIRIGSNVIGRAEKTAADGEWHDRDRGLGLRSDAPLGAGDHYVPARQSHRSRGEDTGGTPRHHRGLSLAPAALRGIVKPEPLKPPRSFASRLLAALKGEPDLTVLPIAASGSASVIGNVRAGRLRA